MIKSQYYILNTTLYNIIMDFVTHFQLLLFFNQNINSLIFVEKKNEYINIQIIDTF